MLERCVFVEDSTLRNCQVVRKAGEGQQGELGELFNRPLKQGLLTLLTTLPPPPGPSLPTSPPPRDGLCTHPAAPGNLTLSI